MVLVLSCPGRHDQGGCHRSRLGGGEREREGGREGGSGREGGRTAHRNSCKIQS